MAQRRASPDQDLPDNILPEQDNSGRRPMTGRRAADLLTITPQGLYCPAGDFHIDPLRPVARALVTHGHADHARAGHGRVLATAETLAIMGVRYGDNFAGSSQTASPGVSLAIGNATVTFFPAGHVLGSAQILIEARDVAGRLTRLVASGDYKREADPTCAAFELVPCDIFITEATFALPIFRHPPADAEIARLLQSLRLFPERAHLLGAYALGKAQRLIALLRAAGYDAPIYMHGAMEKITALYQGFGVELGDVRPVPPREGRGGGDLPGAIVLCPPGALQDRWSRRFADPVHGLASGWMRTRARARQRGVELPLVISDHAGWPDLCRTVVETGAEEIRITHGQEDALAHWCATRGLTALPLHLLGYGDDDAAAAEEAVTDAAAIGAAP
ncbi:DNA ligase-associated DEXH box helicase [Camelimonas fluminis]|nr:DNA ligase-associated DEXH box helicase [Camelimonas fluminis]